MGAFIIFLTAALLGSVYADHQTYPGTIDRPILSDAEAAVLTEDSYLQGWTPEPISIPQIADYVVGPGEQYTDIQEAVNAAVTAGGTERKYIQINPGTYEQTVFVAGEVPLTIYGSGTNPSDVLITLSQGAGTTVADWVNQINFNGTRYKENDPAWSQYSQCADRTEDTIGTTCTSIVWITADNVQVYNLQITNSFNETGDAQAVSLKTDADQIQITRLILTSGQDTLYVGSGKEGILQRVYLEDNYIEGDIDFIFGGACAIYKNNIIKAVSPRHPSSAVVFAPNTHPSNPYGFLVINNVITADETFKSTKVVKLARSWDTSTPAGEYVAGASPNGQLLIRETQIDLILDVDTPYTSSTSSRSFSGNVAPDRDLNNNTFNRMWEYRNYGEGA